MANEFEADVYLGFTLALEGSSISFYAVPGFESAGGRQLAQLLAERYRTVLTGGIEVTGSRAPILRETKMPAVLCVLGAPETVQRLSAALVEATTLALDSWVSDPTGVGS